MKTVLITGTSRGIGEELALYFAKKSYQVISVSRKENKQFTNYENIQHHPLDLTEEEAIEKLMKTFSEKGIVIDYLIHNAGKLVNKPFESLSYQDFLSTFQVNVFGVAMLTQKALPLMKKGSHVVTISSMGGIQGSSKFPGLAAYSSSKGAVITLSELLAEEYKDRGVAFNVLALGAVQTEMLAEAFPGYEAPVSAEEMAVYIANFTETGAKYYNGKVLQVSSTTP